MQATTPSNAFPRASPSYEWLPLIDLAETEWLMEQSIQRVEDLLQPNRDSGIRPQAKEKRQRKHPAAVRIPALCQK